MGYQNIKQIKVLKKCVLDLPPHHNLGARGKEGNSAVNFSVRPKKGLYVNHTLTNLRKGLEKDGVKVQAVYRDVPHINNKPKQKPPTRKAKDQNVTDGCPGKIKREFIWAIYAI